MKTFLPDFCRTGALLLWLLIGGAGLAPLPATAQIEKMSNRKLHAETRKAERQARRMARKVKRDDPAAGEFLDMSVYNMKPNQEGRKTVKTNDGRTNYQFTRDGQPMVTDAPALTNKRMKRKK